ncbi:hypothetical protein PFISCL1PPCAC_11308, partial [Pristionchus fissidentatus]
RDFSERSSAAFRPFDVSSILNLRTAHPEEGWSNLVEMVATLASVSSREFARAATHKSQIKSVRQDSRPGANLQVTFTPTAFSRCDDAFASKHMILLKRVNGDTEEYDNLAMIKSLSVSAVDLHLYEGLSKVLLEAFRVTFSDDRRFYSGYSNQKNKNLIAVPFEWLTSVVALIYHGFNLDTQTEEDERDLVRANLTYAARTIISNN